MGTIARPWWLRAVFFGLAYFGLGIVFSALSRSAASDQARLIWRLAAWAVSGVLYLTHIAYEHFRLRNRPLSIALHVASGAAVGALALAAAAAVHSLMIA